MCQPAHPRWRELSRHSSCDRDVPHLFAGCEPLPVGIDGPARYRPNQELRPCEVLADPGIPQAEAS